MSQKKRVMVCEFHQESNTFNPIPAGFEEFKAGRYLEKQAFYNSARGELCAAQGMIHAIEAAGGEVVPALCLRASSSGGRVADAVFRHLCDYLRSFIKEEGPFDALCVSLHGATCAESEDDACGTLLELLRGCVGEAMPIAASFDLHANITGKVLANADIICGYQTYPHVDFYETGHRAAELCMKKLQGAPIHMAAVRIPMLVPPSGYSTLDEPFKSVTDDGKARIDCGEIYDFTVFNVQPWLDIPELGSTVIALAETEESARRAADQLAERFFDKREQYWPKLLSIDEVIDRAEDSSTAKPVILADASDSPNGGAIGDSVAVALCLQKRKSPAKAGMFVMDPNAVKKAFEVGVGNSGEFTIGAGYTPDMPGPLKGVGKVRSLHDGHFLREGKGGKGMAFDIGLTAVISMDNMDIMVCEAPAASGDPQLLRHFGIEPILYDLVVVKANTSFKAFYEAFAGEIHYADTPGACAANLKRFSWKHIPSGLYPFDLPEDYRLGKAEIY